MNVGKLMDQTMMNFAANANVFPCYKVSANKEMSQNCRILALLEILDLLCLGICFLRNCRIPECLLETQRWGLVYIRIILWIKSKSYRHCVLVGDRRDRDKHYSLNFWIGLILFNSEFYLSQWHLGGHARILTTISILSGY